MPDLLWEDVKAFFDADTMGALPDIIVEDTSEADWEALLDLVRSQRWVWAYGEVDPDQSLPSPSVLLSGSSETLSVWPAPGFQVNFFPYSPESILFDVDLRELQGQPGLDLLCDLLRLIGRNLGKPVLMSAEMDVGHPFLWFDVDTDAVVMLPTGSL
ncbi:hypothetical protein AB0M12_43625 [Nocardia vinacea]